MLKAATLFLTFLLGRMNSSGQGSLFSPEDLIDSATEKITGKLRGLMGQFALGAIGVIFMTAGFLVAFFHLLDQWDVTDILVIDAVFLGGVAMFAVGAILFAFAARVPQKAAKKAKEQLKEKRQHGSLEDAIAAFLQDHVKEREFAREQRKFEREQKRAQRENFYREESSRKADKSDAHVH